MGTSRLESSDTPAWHEDAADQDGSVRILHIDDDYSFLSLTKRMLESSHDVRVATETDPEAALDRVADVDCVVSDYEMPRMDGIEFLEAVRAEFPDLPFILFTGRGSEEVAEEAIRAGVTDYIKKGKGTERFTVLANRITNAVERYRARKQAATSSERLRRIYERIDDGFAAIDEEWRLTYLNRKAAEMIGVSPAEVLGNTIWDVLPGVVDSRFEAKYRYALEHQETVTFEEYYEPVDAWFEVRVFPSESGLSLYFRNVTDRKERELRHRAIFDNTYQFTGLVEPDGTLVDANETALAFVGADRDEVVDKPLWETPWFQANEETLDIAHRSVETARDGEFYRDGFPIEGAHGETVVIDYSVRPVRDDRGEVVLLIAEGRNITERKQRERQLRKEQAFTESLIEAIPDVFYAFDEEGNYIRWNDQFTDAVGYTDEELAEMEPIELVPSEEADKIAEAIDEVLYGDGRAVVESELLTKDGERIPYEFAAARLEEDDTLGVVGVGRDITDRLERERRFEAVFNNTFQFAGFMRPDGTVLEANETALEFAGVDREAVVGKPLWETQWFQATEVSVETAKAAVATARGGELYRDEIPAQGADRTAIIDFSVKPVHDDRGEVTLLITEGRDITKLKERERQLETQNEQLEEFASIISHDLKNPLMVASGNVELARETGEQSALDEALDAMDRMQEMVDDLLELAKQGTSVEHPAPVPFPSLLSTVEHDTGTRVSTDVPSDAAIVADEKRLNSLVCNLVNNAVEHGGDDVLVEVGLEADTLYVADDGTGVPEADREVIFEPGHSGTAGGTGFGLAIVDAIADAHDWDVSVTDSRWGGARFEVSGLDVRFDE